MSCSVTRFANKITEVTQNNISRLTRDPEIHRQHLIILHSTDERSGGDALHVTGMKGQHRVSGKQNQNQIPHKILGPVVPCAAANVRVVSHC